MDIIDAFQLEADPSSIDSDNNNVETPANVPRTASHLVLSMAQLQSGGDAISCASVNSTSGMLPSETDCVGGVASVVASIRELPREEPVLFLPWLDRESLFVQMHPDRLAVNRRVLLDHYQFRAFISTHSLLTLDDSTNSNDSPDATSELRTHEMPFLMSNTLIPPSNPWKEYTKMVHFDDPTGLAMIYIEHETKTLGAPMIESAIGALNYVAVTNKNHGCTNSSVDNNSNNETVHLPCYVPVVLLSATDAPTKQKVLEALTSTEHPPAVLISNQLSSMGDDWLVPQQIQNTWVIQFPFRDPGLSHSFRIEYDPENPLSVANVDILATDLKDFPRTLEGEALVDYLTDQSVLKGLAEVAILNDPVVGRSQKMPLSREGNYRMCMGGECPLGNLWADAIRWGAGDVDVAFVPSGGLRGPGWDAGDVRVSDVYRAMPFANTLCSGVMSGVSLFKLLNYSTSAAAFESTYHKNGDRLLQISGARYAYNTNLNVTSGSSRLISIDVWDREEEVYRPLERLKLYTFAAESFLCEAFQPFATMLGIELENYIEGEIPAVNDDSRYIQEVVSDYLQEFHTDEPFETSIQSRLVNQTEALTPMNLIETEGSCMAGTTFWQEKLKTCSLCPDERQLSFSKKVLEIEVPQGSSFSNQASVLVINSDVEDVSIMLSSLPRWLELSSSKNDPFGKGRPIDISSGEQIGFQIQASADDLNVGNNLGSVQFSVVDDQYPGCFAEQDLLFDVLVKVLPQDDMNHLGAVRSGGLTLMAIIMITSLAFAVWTNRHRKARVVRASQPIFLILLCVGAIIMSSAIVPLSIDDSVASLKGCNVACMTVPWFVSLGFTVVFSALFSKLNRVHKLLTHAESFRKVTITEKDVLKPFLLLLTLNVLFLLLWTVMDPLKWVRLPMSPDNPYSTYGICQSEGSASTVFGTLVLLVDVGAVLLACVHAYQTRNIATEYAESKFIGIALFGLFQLFIVGTPLVFLVRENPKASYFLVSALIFTICMSVLLLMFIPKIHQHLKKNPDEAILLCCVRSKDGRNDSMMEQGRAKSSVVSRIGNFSSVISSSRSRASRASTTAGLRIVSMPERTDQLQQELKDSKEKVALLELRLKEAEEAARKNTSSVECLTVIDESDLMDEENKRRVPAEKDTIKKDSVGSSGSSSTSSSRVTISSVTFAGPEMDQGGGYNNCKR